MQFYLKVQQICGETALICTGADQSHKKTQWHLISEYVCSSPLKRVPRDEKLSKSVHTRNVLMRKIVAIKLYSFLMLNSYSHTAFRFMSRSNVLLDGKLLSRDKRQCQQQVSVEAPPHRSSPPWPHSCSEHVQHWSCPPSAWTLVDYDRIGSPPLFPKAKLLDNSLCHVIPCHIGARFGPTK